MKNSYECLLAYYALWLWILKIPNCRIGYIHWQSIFKHGSCFFFKFNVVIWIPARTWIGQLVFQVGRFWRSVTNTIFPGSFESWWSVKFLCTKNAIVCVADYLLVKDVELVIMSSCCSIIFLFVKLQAMSQNHHRPHRQELSPLVCNMSVDTMMWNKCRESPKPYWSHWLGCVWRDPVQAS